VSGSARIHEVDASVKDGVVACAMGVDELAQRVMDRGQIVILKGAYSDQTATAARTAVAAWGRDVPLAEVDDFRGNYHRRRAMVSRLQQTPHVFHDYNFNDMAALPADIQATLRGLFTPLQRLYNDLTGHDTRFEIPDAGPYVHPQLIQYPTGGGFFGRHWHNLQPQKLGFIVSLSKRGRDYRNGGTRFAIDGEVVDVEERHAVGDICVWRYDHEHWVPQSDLQDRFDWNDDGGRWVATYAYFDPFGVP